MKAGKAVDVQASRPFVRSGAEGEGEPAPRPVPRLRLQEKPAADRGARGVEEASAGPQTRLLLDSVEVAALLGLGRTKVFQMMARAELPVIRIGRCVRVPRTALEDWIRGNTATLVPRRNGGEEPGWGSRTP